MPIKIRETYTYEMVAYYHDDGRLIGRERVGTGTVETRPDGDMSREEMDLWWIS